MTEGEPEMPGAEMSWYWIALAVTLPTGIGTLVALPFWLKGTPMTGGILGSGVIFVAVVAFVGREYVELERLNRACTLAMRVCHPYPEAFTRFCIYLFIGLLEAFALFTLSLSFEERRRRREFAPEWQSRQN